MGVPIIHSVLLNRSTTYSKRSSKAFAMMFKEIERRVIHLKPGSTEPATRFGCRDTQTGAPLKLG